MFFSLQHTRMLSREAKKHFRSILSACDNGEEAYSIYHALSQWLMQYRNSVYSKTQVDDVLNRMEQGDRIQDIIEDVVHKETYRSFYREVQEIQTEIHYDFIPEQSSRILFVTIRKDDLFVTWHYMEKNTRILDTFYVSRVLMMEEKEELWDDVLYRLKEKKVPELIWYTMEDKLMESSM